MLTQQLGGGREGVAKSTEAALCPSRASSLPLIQSPRKALPRREQAPFALKGRVAP